MEIIKNKAELATTGLRQQALDLVETGIAHVLSSAIMKSAVRYDPARRTVTVNNSEHTIAGGRVFVIGGGKASGLMAEALEDIIPPENITAGVVACKGDVSRYRTDKIRIVSASHPMPDDRGLHAVQQMLALKAHYAINASDLVICLISGGGSALLPCPIDGVSLADKQAVTWLLLNCGATIHEINAVRKHLSRTKGGRLGLFFSPATLISLIISDVVGNDLDVIASGPTIPDASTFADACHVLAKYELLSKLPAAVLDYFKKGCRGEVAETPKTLPNCFNYIIGDNSLALKAMSEKAMALGLVPCIVAEQTGETTAVARLRVTEIMNGRYAGHNVVLIGGETTPRLPENPGKGGRNQHYAAVSMLAMKEYPGRWTLACAGTDGSDFLPDVAGAIVDSDSLNAATARGMVVSSYLDRYDSNTLLKKLGNSLIDTGDTGTNVGDVIIYILK